MAIAADPAADSPHIALLLPLNSAAFARHADAVRQGFLAAAKVQGAPLPIRIYPTGDGDTDVLTAYGQAVEAGARLVVGPLARGHVAALAANPLATVPTLALNQTGPGTVTPSRFYELALNVETEARQIARLAYADGRRNALVIGDTGPLSARIRHTFADEFGRLGGRVALESPYAPAGGDSARLRQTALAAAVDMALLAIDATQARLVRPQLDAALPLYATSLANPGYADGAALRELASLRFVDMPWLVAPQHAAVMVYPRPRFDATDLDRLYALGIDAFRLTRDLLRQAPAIALDGVTGAIRLLPDRQFARELTAVEVEPASMRILAEPRP